MAEHPNKHIQEAIRYAESHGWVVTHAGPQAHIWGMLWCPHHARDGCHIHIMSTLRSPENLLGTSAVLSTAVPTRNACYRMRRQVGAHNGREDAIIKEHELVVFQMS